MKSMAALGLTNSGPSWNPFRCGGTVLLTNVLLAAKLIAAFLLSASLGGVLGESPPLFAALGDSFRAPLLRWTLQGACFACAFLLLFNRRVGLASSLLGLLVLVNAVFFGPGPYQMFCGLFLLIVGLQRDDRSLWLLRTQVALLYLAVGIAGLLGASPENFFETLAGRGASTDFMVNQSYAALDSALPPGVLSNLLSWGTTFIALALGAGFLVRRFHSLAIWTGIVFHMALWSLGAPLLAAPYAVLAFYLVFADWPRTRLVVLYDGDCGFCNKTREWISRFDLEGLYDWKPYQSGAGADFGISQEALERRAYVVSPRGADSGFQAFRMMVLYNPLTYFGIAAVVTAFHGAPLFLQNAVLAALILVFSPLFRPVGELGYDWVARNRHRLPPRTCKAP
jgi:predicted DCC family thiol-disulfide oxidoreductase YuxK